MSWLRRLSNTLRTGRVRVDIDRELSFHIAERVEQLRAEGLTVEEATRRARIQFGNPAVQIERTLDVDIAHLLDVLLRNLRYALRALRRTPGFTVAVVLTLALGIGANSAVFSAIDAVLLQPLPYPEGDRLVLLRQVVDGAGESGIAPVRISDWNRLNSTFERISGYVISDAIDTRGETPLRFRQAAVASGFLDVVGVRPAIGRDFAADDHRLASPSRLLISDRFWREGGADPHVIDRPIQTQGVTIWPIGVMPPAFRLPEPDIDVWGPDDADAPWQQSRSLTWFTGIGRLKPGVTLAQAQADLEGLQARLGEQYPQTDRGIAIRIAPLKDTIVGSARGSLWLVFGAVSILLLIACTNIAALLLSRAARREQEIAVRYSLGGTRRAVAAQLLAEAGMLALVGAACGLLLAVAASRALRMLVPDLPRVSEIGIDSRILLYTATATVFVALACGLLPALRGARARSLGGSARTQVSSRQPIQWTLVGVQVALSVTLLAGAGLLLRTVAALSNVDPGFDSARVLTLRISGSYGTETTTARVQRLNRVLDELDARPDVDAVAIASQLPGVRAEAPVEFMLAEGRAGTAPPLIAESRVVAPGYFATMRIPVLAGELCRRTADAGWPGPVQTEVMVNRRFVERYLAGRPAVGLHVKGGLDYLVENGHLVGAPAGRIAGIVGNAREHGADRQPVPTVYTCFTSPDAAPWFLVRTAGEPLTAVAAIRRRINELEPQRAVYEIAPLEQRIGSAYAQNRLRTWLLAAFAATALGLVCAGVYGTLSYAVSLRRREVALRLALGAPRGGVVRTLMATSVRVVGFGAAAGLVLALVFTRSLSAMLYGVSPSDPATLSGVVGLVLAVAAVAALVPAARAAFVQPMRVLRDE
jgi:predicted permease